MTMFGMILGLQKATTEAETGAARGETMVAKVQTTAKMTRVAAVEIMARRVEVEVDAEAEAEAEVVEMEVEAEVGAEVEVEVEVEE